VTEAGFPFTDKAAAAVHWLLPRISSDAAAGPATGPHLLMSDFLHVRDAIGTPDSLNSEIVALQLDADQRLPPTLEGLLSNTVTLFALAMEAFDNRDQALRWWRTPIRLSDSGPYKTPRDWIAEPGAASDLAARIRRTLNGIF